VRRGGVYGLCLAERGGVSGLGLAERGRMTTGAAATWQTVIRTRNSKGTRR